MAKLKLALGAYEGKARFRRTMNHMQTQAPSREGAWSYIMTVNIPRETGGSECSLEGSGGFITCELKLLALERVPPQRKHLQFGALGQSQSYARETRTQGASRKYGFRPFLVVCTAVVWRQPKSFARWRYCSHSPYCMADEARAEEQVAAVWDNGVPASTVGARNG